ncbi:DUF2169 domain-containing protein [Chondromyces apiculatus]|uniref:DUF2169 domain-containing protein n=1 Tax=Chondromyces apiculatus DSM 436 TaxID=1192034 RepID=A0A017SZ49_9BACT|nr:DUF2169 domain-containing protein [Chondromyces apiculatus]EYF02274.1 Hypothetical protein CAP_7346 [Chondromyces apiculatus DSM 436]
MSATPPSLALTQRVACMKSADSKLWLVCIARRTYAFAPGRVKLADAQLPLTLDPDIEVDPHDRYRTLREDTDLFPPKPATDVVVTGSKAHAPGKVQELMVGVAVGRSARVLKVLGERRVEVTLDGDVHFPDPAPFESVPLTWDLAYGGYDAYAHDELDPPERRNGRRIEPSPRDEGVFAYPRNKVGRAYFIDVDRDRADGELLPQIDDPGDPLTPSRFFVPSPLAWLDAPASAGLGWVPHTWYPRIMRSLGAFLEHDPPTKPIREMAFPDGDDLRGPFLKNEILPRHVQGAVPGLASERLRGNELVILKHLVRGHPELQFTLPGERPTITVRPPGVPKVFTPDAVLQTVRIDGEQQTVSLTWCGAVRLVAPLAEEQLAETQLGFTWR